MLIASSVSIPLETKDPHEAVTSFIEVLRSKVSNFERISITLGVISMTYPDILVNIAKRLPKTADGFGMDRSVTAAKFLEDCATGNMPKPSVCTCDVTDYLSVSESLSLIESFFDESKRSVRSTSFTLNAKNIVWKGDESKGSGRLDLFDLRSFGHKQRFTLTAGYHRKGQNSRDPSVKAGLSLISQSTNIAFDRGIITESPDPETIGQLSPNQILIVQKCFDEAFEETGRKLRQENIDWRKLPGLASQDESFSRRMESVLMGKKERVNFLSTVRRFMKETFPDFRPCKYGGEQLFFVKNISPEVELALGFDRIHMMGYGKAFTLLLGVNFIQGPLSGQRWEENLFGLFRQRMPPYWTYITTNDLAEVLNGMSAFLGMIVNAFEKQLMTFLCPVPSTLPHDIMNRGAITAQQALNEALKASLDWSNDAAVYSITSSGTLRLREAGMGPMIDLQGRLRPHGRWCFFFYSSTQKKAFVVEIPSVGSVSCSEFDFGLQQFGGAGQSVFSSTDNWIDSNKAMEIAEANGGYDARQEAYSCWDILIKLTIFDPDIAVKTAFDHVELHWSQEDQDRIKKYMMQWDPKDIGFRWKVEYLMNRTKNSRGDIVISFDAVDGKRIKVSPF